MKRRSKKQRRLDKQRAMVQKRHPVAKGVVSRTPCTDKPISSMVVRRTHIYTPTSLDGELLSQTNADHAITSASQIVFKPGAVRQLQRFIDWGASTERNRVEQQGILLGGVYETPTGYVGVVEAVLLSDAVGDRIYVESTHSEWSRMDSEMDRLNQDRVRKLVKVGWWHTHPSMAIFMSGTDRATQTSYFHKDWQFAVVLDPHHERWGAFVGGDAQACVGHFLYRDLFRHKAIERERDAKRGGE